MDSNSAKYQVAVAVKNNWFPGHTITTFDFIISKSTVITLKVLEAQRDLQGKTGEVIGYVLVERGVPVKTKPAKAVKTAK